MARGDPSVGFAAFTARHASDHGALLAALVIVSASIVLLFALVTRYIVAGHTVGVGK